MNFVTEFNPEEPKTFEEATSKAFNLMVQNCSSILISSVKDNDEPNAGMIFYKDADAIGTNICSAASHMKGMARGVFRSIETLIGSSDPDSVEGLQKVRNLLDKTQNLINDGFENLENILINKKLEMEKKDVKKN